MPDDVFSAAVRHYHQQQHRQSSPSAPAPVGQYELCVESLGVGPWVLATPWMQQALGAIPQDPDEGYDYMESHREQGRRRCDQRTFVPIQRPQQQLQQSSQQQPLPQAYRDSSSREPAVAPGSPAPSRAAAPAGQAGAAHTNRSLQQTRPSPAAQQQAATRAAGAATAPVDSLGTDGQPRYIPDLWQVLQESCVERPGCLTAPTTHRDQAKPAAATGGGTPGTSILLATTLPLVTSVLGSANGTWCV